MIVTYSLAIVAIVCALAVFFSPAFAYTTQVIVDGVTMNNVSFLNLALNVNYINPVFEYKYDPGVSVLLVMTFATLLAMIGCILFIVYYKSKTGLKIKRNIFSCAVGFAFCITDLFIISYLTYDYAVKGVTIGLAFIFYYLAIIAALGLLIGQIIAIIFKFKEKWNKERFDELIEVERSRLPYIKDPYKKELALANLKYMESCNTAPKVTKEELEARRQNTLQMMLENPLPEHHCCGLEHHDHEDEDRTCKVGSDK